jgi:cytidylate kinase
VIVVAIDGPAGSGKSTVARALARRLGVPHVDTGAYYRAVTLAALRAGVTPGNPAACSQIAAAAQIERRGDRTFMDGEDVEDQIRDATVTAAVSAVSAHPEVRAVLRRRQRDAVPPGGAVVDGRDAGTAVVPHAPLKVWLTATPTERARRRAGQVGADTRSVPRHEQDLLRRDAEDATYMVPAPDAVHIDTTDRSVEDLVDELVALVQQRSTSERERP